MDVDFNIFDAEELRTIEVEIAAHIDSLTTPVDKEIRSLLEKELLEKVENSTQPDRVVLDYLTEAYEFTRDFKFPEGAVEDEALHLIHHQYIMAKELLESIVARGFDAPCEHFPRQTPLGSRQFTVKEQAAHLLKHIQNQRIEDAAPGKTNAAIEAVISRFLGTLEHLPEDVRKIVADGYRVQLLDSSDPRAVIRRRLSRYSKPDGTISIPKEERFDRAIQLLTVRLDHAAAGLTVISSERDLSCGDHHVVYAGGVESEGNRIFTIQKLAEHSLQSIEGYTLERIHLG